MMMRELLLLIGLWRSQVCAFRRNGAEATTFQVDEVRVPEPTPPPTLLLQHDNLKRAAATSSGLSNNVCGWVDGNEDAAFTCNDPTATCLWDPALNVVGCGAGSLTPFITSCFDYASASDCVGACASNAENTICPSAVPYCRTVLFPSSYTMLPCGTASSLTTTVAFTYSAFSTPILLPRSLLANGTIAYATQAVPSSAPSITPPPSAPISPLASIIPAVLGGAVLIAGLPFGIKVLIRKRQWARAMRADRLPNEREALDMRTQDLSSLYVDQPPAAYLGNDRRGGRGFMFSQDWYGRSKR